MKINDRAKLAEDRLLQLVPLFPLIISTYDLKWAVHTKFRSLIPDDTHFRHRIQNLAKTERIVIITRGMYTRPTDRAQIDMLKQRRADKRAVRVAPKPSISEEIAQALMLSRVALGAPVEGKINPNKGKYLPGRPTKFSKEFL